MMEMRSHLMSIVMRIVIIECLLKSRGLWMVGSLILSVYNLSNVQSIR